MNYRVTHTTKYHYSELVSLCHNEARITPRSFFNQTCLESNLTIDPTPTTYREREDFFGNRTAYFSIEQPHKILAVTSTSTVRIVPYSDNSNLSNITWQDVRDHVQTSLEPTLLEVKQYTLNSPMVICNDALKAYAEPSFPLGRPLIEAVQDLNTRIHAEFKYVPGFTTIATPLSTVLKHRRGVCQDFAHLAIGCLRSLDLPARYISGYLETLPPPGKERLVGADASHAWFSIYVPQHGWIDFDPTNNVMPSDQHITVAWGRDFADVTPLKGVILGSGKHDLEVSVDVERLRD